MTATIVLMSDIKVLLTVVIVLMAAIIVPMAFIYSFRHFIDISHIIVLSQYLIFMITIIVLMSSNYSSDDGWSTTAATGLGHRTIDRNGQIRTQGKWRII